MSNNIDFTKFPLYLEGELKGELKGKEEVAEIMLRDNMPIAQIMKFTGLTLEQIQAIQEKITT